MDTQAAAQVQQAQTQQTAENSFDTLSLSMMPLKSETLRKAQLVKNAQMETMVQLISDPKAGNLQIRPDQIADNFAISAEDQQIVDKLSALKSFDVYSLRTNLKSLGIEVNSAELQLSTTTKEKLRRYSLEFTRPLIISIFGNDDGADMGNDENLFKIFRDPDKARVTQHLKTMSEKLGIAVEGIPQFLMDYNDLFMSGAYYRHTYDTVQPTVARFNLWMQDVKSMRDVESSPQAAKAAQKTEEAMKFLIMCVGVRMDNFKTGFEGFWQKMSKQNFDRLRRKAEDNNVGMGALLCGLTVKMDDWKKNFPDNDAGSPQTRMKYMLSFATGIEKLQNNERDAQLMEANF